METALISVIVPVYNVAQYLEKSIASIQKQTYQNLEIILVDDGATDESGRLCDSIAELDDRVSVLHKKNEGLSQARNDGMKQAQGIIWFLLTQMIISIQKWFRAYMSN